MVKKFVWAAILGLVVVAAIEESAIFEENYATCLIDEMPGIENDLAAHAATQVCKTKHPRGFYEIKRGSGRGWFSYDSGAECTLDKSKKTASRVAARQIRVACNVLYDEPNPFEDPNFGK